MYKSKVFWCVGLFAVGALMFSLITTADAAGCRGGGCRGRRVQGKMPEVPLVQSVTDNSITVKYGSKVNQYTADKLTNVTIEGKRAKLSDITPGMIVTISEAGGGRVTRIAADPAPTYAGKKK